MGKSIRLQTSIPPARLLAATLRWTAIAILVAVLLVCVEHPSQIGVAVMAAQQASRSGAGAQDNGYVGSLQCARCHAAIYKKFSQTSMGHSMEAIVPETIASFKLPSEFYDARVDRHFAVFAKDGRLFQSEYQRSADGTETFRDTHPMKWKIGAGKNGFGAILEDEHTLFQAPLSYYTKTSEWSLSPGYEFGDYGFNRPILAGCISCHSGRPRPIAGTNGRYADPAFFQLPIGCENCHGPGEEHIRRMDNAKSGALSGEAAGIVNPKDLPMPLANQICMSCHELGDVRVFREGKTYQDFRPGTTLDRVVSVFLVPPKPESPPQADHLEHYYAMTLSKCYRASGVKMGCITCHDPHVEPSREQAPAYFNAKCMTCHTARSCTRTTERVVHAGDATDNGNCIGCHMPKREIKEISHSSVTNHRILARPDESFPVEAFRATTQALPDLIHLDPDPNSENDEVPLITLLQAYGELAANRPEYATPYLNVLAKLESTYLDHELVQTALGRRDLLQGEFQQAEMHLRRALQLGTPQAAIYGDLAQAEVKLGNVQQAVSDLETGIKLDPFNPILQKNLVVQLIALKRYPEALTAIERYLDRFPQDSTMRKALEMAKRTSGSEP